MDRKEKRDNRKKGIVTAEKNNWLKKRAKELNSDLPKSEIWFLEQLKAHNINITFAQNFVCNHYIIDFRYQELAIEVDGSIHDLEEVKEKDKIKNEDLELLGFQVIRIKAFSEQSLKIAIKKIKAYLKIKPKVRARKAKHLMDRIQKSNKRGIEKVNKLSSNNDTNKKIPCSCQGCKKSKAIKKLIHKKKQYNFCEKCYNEAQKAIKIGLV